MFLHVAAQPFPIRAPTAQRRKVVEVLMGSRESGELVVIVDVFLFAAAEQQPELFVLMPRRVS